MSLRGYVKKGKPALWTQLRKPPEAKKPLTPASKAGFLRSGRVKVAGKLPKRLKSRSSAMEAKMKVYRTLAAALLKANPVCACCRDHTASSVHHVRGRVGALLLQPKHWLGVCFACHNFIHNNIEWSRRRGLIAAAGDWNKET